MRPKWTAKKTGDSWAITAGGAVVATVASLTDAKKKIFALAREALTADASAGGQGWWRANLIPEGTQTDESAVIDGEEWGMPRLIDQGACYWDEGPLPLMLQTENEGGHYGAELCGSITSLSRDGNSLIVAEGPFDNSSAGAQAIQILTDRERFGISADTGQFVADFECVEEDEDGWCVAGIMRFSEMQIIGATIVPFPAFGDLSFIELVDAETSEETEGDQAVAASIVAAAIPASPPAEWFEDPQFECLTPLTITDDGRIFGHAAPFGVCHIGIPGECRETPRSASGYAYFRTGCVKPQDRDETIPTGVITMGTGHAPLEMSAAEASAHYDHSGFGVADVACGEDEFGVWIAGALRPGVTEEQIRTLRGCSLSGDWRPLRGKLELVRFSVVNTPGFPVERVQARVASGHVSALVAAGAKVMAAVTASGDCGCDDKKTQAGTVRNDLAAVRSELAELKKVTAPLAMEQLKKRVHQE